MNAPPSNLAISDRYIELIRAFPLVHIRDDAHMDAAMATLWPLLEQQERTSDEEAYIGALTDLIEVYEAATVPAPAVSGIAVVRHLMAEHGLRQKDLAPIFGTPSIVSEVLTGKRPLALTHMKKLADYFHVSPATFFD
ncbi:MAG TPA: helix-turn-helix domain-containing protein [Chloroflexota bacterium]|nr:helix-turn-helix domain-containing protein [Chloroflexota bacterium]